MVIYELAAEGEADAGSLADSLCREEVFKNFGSEIFRDSRTIVRDTNFDALILGDSRFDLNLRAVVGAR